MKIGRFAAVRSVSGRVESVWADTLILRVRALVSDSAPASIRRPARVVVVRDASARVSTRRLSRVRTVGLTLIIAAAALAVAFEEWEEWLEDSLREAFESCRPPECQ